MKTRKYIVAAMLLVVAVAAAILVGCKKEKQEVKVCDVKPNNQVIGNMDDYLISFKKRMLSATKGDESISLEQAQRDLGNLLNFDFGDANYATDEIQYDTVYVSLDISGEEVELCQLAETYNIAYSEILEAFEQVTLPNKSVQAISCSLIQDAKAAESAEVRLVLSTRGLNMPAPKTRFDETDNWRVWERLGKCDGTCVGDDHCTMLKKVYNNNHNTDCAFGRVYYTNINSVCIHAEQYIESDYNIHYNHGYRLWVGYGNEVLNNCIDYQEMQYYYENLCQILRDEVYLTDDYKILSILDCFLDTPLSVNPNREYFFACEYQYGKPNLTGYDY